MKTPLRLTFAILICCLSLSSCFGGKTPDIPISYQGVSFDYPSYWKAETEDLGDDSYYIGAEEKFSSGTLFLVQFTEGDRDQEAVIGDFFESLDESGFDVTTEPIQVDKFGKYDCKYVRYKITKALEKAYGIVYSFDAEGRSFRIVKQSEKEYDLKHEKYKIMENSFDVEAAQ